MTNNFDKIEQEIINELNTFFLEVKQNNYHGNTIWTKRLKERIGYLGKEKGYYVATAGCDGEFEKEWLYDVVWYVEDNEGRLESIFLIVESEWEINYSGIKYDFEKLLVGRAHNRLMICQSRSHNIENLFEEFKKAIDAFKGNFNDRFLIAILDYDTEDEFHFKTYTKQML